MIIMLNLVFMLLKLSDDLIESLPFPLKALIRIFKLFLYEQCELLVFLRNYFTSSLTLLYQIDRLLDLSLIVAHLDIVHHVLRPVIE